MASDLQDPPELLRKLINKWENGSKVVFGQKNNVKDNFVIKNLRNIFYSLLLSIADIKIIKNATGFGIYDQSVITLIKNLFIKK